MSWKKHFTRYDGTSDSSRARANRWQSWLPEVYSGQPNRTERYNQYDQMDMDSEINTALDTISEFSTQKDFETNLSMEVFWKSSATEAESGALQAALNQWYNINDFDRRMFGLFRSAIKYGDQFFIRDPETWKLIWVSPEDVTKAIVNESSGKDIDQYIMKNLSPNFNDLTTKDTKKIAQQNSNTGYTTPMGKGAGVWHGGYQAQNTEFSVPASHVVHIALTDGMNMNWPFGTSVLESVFKVYKQKELLEDSIIIYRVQRAPERRVFYIDVGNMPAHKAMQFVERVKNEVHQTRIPNKSGGGTNVMDAAYNPLSIMEDYFFAQTAEGRGSKVEVLPGGDNLGEIDDLKYFSNKMMRGLRVPSSYLPTGSDDGTATYQDGRVGTALIQEYRFSKFCERLQTVVAQTLDKEFKLFLKNRGVSVSSSLFEIRFTEPQSFSQYRELELDQQKAQVFSNLEGVDYLSRRFMLKKYLGLTETEIVENERLWREENDSNSLPETDDESNLGAVGLRSGDLDSFEPTDIPDDVDPGEEVDISDTGDDASGSQSPIPGGGTDNEI